MVRHVRRQSPRSLALVALLVAAFLPTTAQAAATGTDRVAPVALGLALILVAANVGGHVAVRLGQIAVLGELMAGVVLGNLPGLDVSRGWSTDPSIDIIARLGALVLLFDVGLELTVREVFAVGRSAVAVAISGTLVSLVCGWLVATAIRPDAGMYSHPFIGAALTATSIGITARVLQDLGKTGHPEARVILGAAIIDDVFGLLILTTMTASVSTAGALGTLSLATLAVTVAKAAAFFGIAFLVGSRTAPIVFAAVAKLRTSGAQVAIGLSLCLMGARMDLRALASGRALGVAAALTLTAVVGKLACALAASGVRRVPVGVGMIPRAR